MTAFVLCTTILETCLGVASRGFLWAGYIQYQVCRWFIQAGLSFQQARRRVRKARRCRMYELGLDPGHPDEGEDEEDGAAYLSPGRWLMIKRQRRYTDQYTSDTDSNSHVSEDEDGDDKEDTDLDTDDDGEGETD